eukprot:gene7514-5298_t
MAAAQSDIQSLSPVLHETLPPHPIFLKMNDLCEQYNASDTVL